MKIVVGSDHGGFELKEQLKERLLKEGHQVEDAGCYDARPVDYPDVAVKLAGVVNSGAVDFGLLCCGTGIGISIAANKVKGIRAALCGCEFQARATRQHNNANVLCLGERVTGQGVALDIAELFLNTAFEGGRHLRRINQIEG